MSRGAFVRILTTCGDIFSCVVPWIHGEVDVRYEQGEGLDAVQHDTVNQVGHGLVWLREVAQPAMGGHT